MLMSKRTRFFVGAIEGNRKAVRPPMTTEQKERAIAAIKKVIDRWEAVDE